MLAGSRLFNAGDFFETHEEWEEVWRRAAGPRRELLRGLIQVSVGYEHWKRGNASGAVSLLSQGVRRLRYHTSKPGVRELRQTARSDAEKIRDGNMDVRPPKVVCCIVGHPPRGPKSAIVVEVPAAKKGK